MMLELLEWPSESKGHRVEFSQVRHNSISIFRELSFFLPISQKKHRPNNLLATNYRFKKLWYLIKTYPLFKCSLKCLNPLPHFDLNPHRNIRALWSIVSRVVSPHWKIDIHFSNLSFDLVDIQILPTTRFSEVHWYSFFRHDRRVCNLLFRD